MRIGEVIGTVTLARAHPALTGARYLITVPFSLEALKQGERGDGEDLVVYDHLGAGLGSLIGFSESAEAAAPFNPNKTPVDAYCALILDQIEIRSEP